MKTLYNIEKVWDQVNREFTKVEVMEKDIRELSISRSRVGNLSKSLEGTKFDTVFHTLDYYIENTGDTNRIIKILDKSVEEQAKLSEIIINSLTSETNKKT